ncbi:DUF5916 domain-containing protein [Pseudoalteromonas fenneropenaei]|uniref:DUF5916 domain-containing protein n=1 Tax=Pseudoalteromonas fenneropenaei TaxID=1737459 RepID=A0ABV7CLJ3_9GAMM
MKKQLGSLLVSFLLPQSGMAVAQQQSPYPFARGALALKKMTTAPQIDGVFSAHEWDEAVKISDFVLFRPTVGDKPKYPLTAYLSYDDNFLYVAAEIFQPQDTITDRVLTQGSSIWNEDYFGITLDTNFDKRDGYLFHVSPSGVKEDGLVNGTDYIAQWSTLWYAKTSRFADGWRVEMAIPMQSLSFDPALDTWGIQLRHKLSAPYQQVYWNLNDGETYGWAAGQVAPITQLTGLKQGLGVELKPGLALSKTAGEHAWTPSLDAFYKLTPNLTGVVTLNTDFSGTEVDEVNMNLTRFQQYYSEKRDFFLQDSQVFSFGGLNDYDQNGMPFYSRRIGQGAISGVLDINWGTKLAGQIGDTRIGVLSVNQAQDGAIDDSTQLSVVRLSHQLNSTHQLGMIATQGNAQNSGDSLLWGIDYRYEDAIFTDQRLEAYAWYQETQSQHASDDTKAYGGQMFLPNDAVYMRAKYRYIGADYRPALGFVNRRGIQYYELVNHFRHRPKQGPLADYLNYFQFTTFFWQTDDTDNHRLSQEYRVRPLQFEFKDSSWLYVQHETRKEQLKTPYKMGKNITFAEQDFTFSKWKMALGTDSSKPLFGEMRIASGDFYDSEVKEFEFDLNYKPNKFISLALSRQLYHYQRQIEKEQMYGTRLRVNVAFNPDWSWQTLLQHNTQSDSLSVFSRLRYQSRPDELYQLSFNRGFDLSEGWHERLTQFNETALKLNYTFRW